jgi:hypothetical protein
LKLVIKQVPLAQNMSQLLSATESAIRKKAPVD